MDKSRIKNLLSEIALLVIAVFSEISSRFGLKRMILIFPISIQEATNH